MTGTISPHPNASLPAGRTLDARLLSWPRWRSCSYSSSRFCMRLARSTIGFADWRPILYAYLLWAVALGDRPGHDPGRTRACGRCSCCRPSSSPSPMVIFPTLFGLYIAFTDWNLSSFEGRAASTASTISSRLFHDPYYWNALGNMVFYVLAVLGRIRDRLRAGAAAQRRDPGAQVLPRRLPAALHAEPGRGELDDRQVDDGVPLRPGGHAGALSRLGQSGLLRLALDRPVEHHGDGRLGFDSVHDDPAARRPAGAAQGGAGSRQGRRRQRLAVLLAGHLSR